MIAFFLSMPGRGSYNGKWTGEGRPYVRVYSENSVPKEYIGQSFEYRWNDGWVAVVSVEKVDSKEGNKLRKRSVGFNGYDWMIESIINHGKIITNSDFIEKEGTDEQKFILSIYNIANICYTNKDFTYITDCSLSYNNVRELVDKNILDKSTELYSGGPTVQEILKFMSKYKEILYILQARVKDRKFTFTCMYKNCFDKNICAEPEDELDKILKNAPSSELMFNGKNMKYIFI